MRISDWSSDVCSSDLWTPPVPDEEAPVDQPALPGEQVLLDLNQLADGHAFFSLGGSTVTPDENLIAFSVDTVGDERFTTKVLDLTTGNLIEDEITGVLGGETWPTDGGDFFYTTVHDSWRPAQVRRQPLGNNQSKANRR